MFAVNSGAMMEEIGPSRSLVDRRTPYGGRPGEESPMLARDLFGPAAEQRVHDRMAEVERERQRDLATAPAASITWQSAPPRMPREREALPHVGVGRADWQSARDLNSHRKTASNPITNILRKLGVRKRTAVARMMSQSLPGTVGSSDG
jgi:DNA-binding CsgD family transcriptional regulator